MLTELGKRTNEHSENFNKELECIRKTQSEMKNSIAAIKNTRKELNSRLSDTEEHISDLKHRIMENTQSEQQKEKRDLKK